MNYAAQLLQRANELEAQAARNEKLGQTSVANILRESAKQCRDLAEEQNNGNKAKTRK